MSLLTTTEAARRCAVSARTMLRWVESGRVRGTRTAGGHWRIAPSALAHLVPAQRSAPGGLRFAIIEDDPREARALERLLLALRPGARVGIAHDGLAAGLLLGRTPPHVAFVDIEMPHLDGIEVIRRAVDVPGLCDTRFVVVSGHLDAARRAALSPLPVWELFDKPVQPGRVAALLDRLPVALRAP